MAENKDKSDIAKREEEILAFWNENSIFEKSEKKDSPLGDYVFYDGPPFATGLPHYGHLLAGTIKDAIPRYKTMRGFRVGRKWGWDCHGLPLENEIEKELNLTSKKDIEEIGVAKFNAAAKAAVLRYADDWKKIVPRMGRWVDMESDYKTMDTSYTESVWWVFKELHSKGLVYEGFKAMHLCPRCGTTLSNFEVAQGYKDITDLAVTVKLELKDEPGTFLLAWTTTPWTLPGNMAAAVNKNTDYVNVRIKNNESGNTENYILAKELVKEVLGESEYEFVKELQGKELIGKEYIPPFDYFVGKELENKENAWKVYHADYVSTEEGTGIVHLAPAFGAEDMELAREHKIPIVHHVGKDGAFTKAVTDFNGVPVKPKGAHQSADIEIIKYLAHKGLLFKKEKIKHSYPHCWRCDTPLLNYASSSWFVEVTKFKDKLSAENKKVRWVPEDIRDGRFGRWLEGARDWSVSRARYWGAPLPVWRREGDDKKIVVIDSVSELKKYAKRSGNNYYMMRHGESVFNTKGVLSSKTQEENVLTEKGKEQAKEAARGLEKKKIDYIYYSPLNRTKETALLIAEELGLGEEALTEDVRLKEVSFGEFEGKTIDEYHSFFAYAYERLTKLPEGGETWRDVKKRVTESLFDIERAHANKNILIVSHNGPLQMLQTGAYGLDLNACASHIADDSFDVANAEIRELPFVPFPHNEMYELDIHRPYIDELELVDTDGTKLVRVLDVFDCWFESGSMPYGQHHYPCGNLDTFEPKKERGFPADFIAEGLDQTRGWFYSLIVLGVALFNQSPYKNVIVNGLILAEDGRKMSKRLKNYPEPMLLVDKYGADSLRFYMLSSPAMRGEDLHFSEQGVQEVMRKNIGRLGNVLAFYELYADKKIKPSAKSSHILDRWVIARLYELMKEVTEGMENYELERATRPIGLFIDDLSTWYVRRSRDRFKGEDIENKERALATTRFVLIELSKIMAPFMPFFAEEVYQRVKTVDDKESVHLVNWPLGGGVSEDLLATMHTTREVVAALLQERDKAGIKVRQPLQSFTTNKSDIFPELVKDEGNVLDVIVTDSEKSEDGLNTELSEELKEEGLVREVMREIQEKRKEAGLTPGEVKNEIAHIEDSDEHIAILEKHLDRIRKATLLPGLQLAKGKKDQRTFIWANK